MNILFVCLGNICRSPLAASVCRKYIAEDHLENHIGVESAGTIAYHYGDPPDRRMAAAASRRNIEILNRSKPVLARHFEAYDLILAMDSENYSDLLEMALEAAGNAEQRRDYTEKIRMFRDFDPDGPGEVPDPYYGGSGGFELVIDMVERTCRNLVDQFAGSAEEHADTQKIKEYR